MEVKIESSKLVKPLYHGIPPSTSDYTSLSVFDKVTHNLHVPVIFAYRPPTPSNVILELGLRKALAEYREFAGRLTEDNNGNPIILLNDKGVRFVEASVDSVLDQTILLKPSMFWLSLHPGLNDVVELAQFQLTRFSCGSMVVGCTSHHFMADGHTTSNFLVAWGQASRGLKISPLPFRDRTIFTPRNPPNFEFEHEGAEYFTKNFKKVYPFIDYDIKDIVVQKVHYTTEFLLKLKAKASSSNRNNKPFSTFESLVAHLWRAITRARGLNGSETTRLRIAVDGRSRLNPKVSEEYLGNVVLWAFASAKVDDLLRQPVSYATRVLHEAIIKVNDKYFKSFIDFASHKIKEEGLVTNTSPIGNSLCPDMEVDSWLRFPFCDLDFGQGGPYILMPSFFPREGVLFLVPSFIGDGSIAAFVPLFQHSLSTFNQICYSLD